MIQMGPPHIPAVDDTERQRFVFGQLCKGLFQLRLIMGQVDVQAGGGDPSAGFVSKPLM